MKQCIVNAADRVQKHDTGTGIRQQQQRRLIKKRRAGEILSEDEAREEQIMLGLRTAKGIPESICDRAAVETLVAEGALIRIGDAQIRIPESSFFVSDSIIAKLI